MALVPPKTFSAKHNKKKVKVTVDAAGLHVVEDNKQAADLGSYKLNKMKTWSVNGKKNSFELVMTGKKGKTLVFATKEAPGIDMAIQSATMAMAAWRASHPVNHSPRSQIQPSSAWRSSASPSPPSR